MPEYKTSNTVSGKVFFFVLCCFFLSGLSGLIYEILWTRMIIKIIGSAPFAISIILTIFMGGLGLGSYLAGRLIDRVREPLVLVRIYGMLELAIGVYAILIPLFLTAFKPLQTILYNELYDRFLIYNLLTFVSSSLILCIPVMCMGATLPILCRFYVARLSHLGTHAGRLYGLNTVGAALGALLCGFWLISLLGVYGTLLFAFLVNIVIGLSCVLVSYKVNLPHAEITETTPGLNRIRVEAEESLPAIHPAEAKGALVIFAVSGFCSMACEVIWTKLLGLIIGPTTYSFTVVLATFITGLALGSMIFGYLADRVERPIWLLLGTQVIAALLVLAVSQLLGTSQMFFAKLLYTFKESFGLLSLLKASILFVFMVLPTVCFGATFPLVGRICTTSVSKVGSSIGFAYMLNTVGSLFGSFCAGFLLIPLAGKESSLGMIVSLQLLTSLVVAGIALKKGRQVLVRFALVGVLALTGLALCLHYPVWDHQLLSIGKYERFKYIGPRITATGWLKSLFHGSEILSKAERGELVYYGDGIGGFTTVLKYRNAFGNIQYMMANSGKPDASTGKDMSTQTLFAHLPMLFHENPKRVMVLGLASGVTAGEVLCYPVEILDILEISDQVVEASDLFIPWNNHVLSDPRTHLIIQDGRAHLELTRQDYDVIISEPSNPWMAGLAALFTDNFFALARDRLRDNGIFVQFLHAYQMDWKTFSLVGRSFARVFPDSLLVSTSFSEYGGDYLLVGFKGKERLALEYIEQKLVYARKSRNVILTDPRLLYKLILSEDLKRLFGRGNVNTDSRPRLEFAAPKVMYHDDELISKKLESGKQKTLGTRTRNILRQVNGSVDFQIDVAAYALSVFSPFRNMFDLSGATALQKDRFLKLLEGYCSENELDYSIFKENEAKQRCLSTQIESIQRNKALLQGNSHSLVYLAGLYNMAGNRPQAIRYYTEALRMNPGDAVSHNKLGTVLEVQGKMIEAVVHYSEALRIDPTYAEAHNNLGNVLANQGKTDEAIYHLSQALRINPTYAVAHNNLGCVLANLGKTDEAINHLSQALGINPGLAKAHNNLGVVLLRKGQIEEAVVHFQEALQLNPDFLSAHYNLKQAAGLRGK